MTCVVADDHPPIINSVSRFLSDAGFSVVATAADGEAALAAVEELRPRALVADVRMPRLDGLELARRVTASPAETAVVLYSGVGTGGMVAEALDAGADGFVLKSSPLDDLARAIDAITRGDIYIDPLLAAQLAGPGRGGRRQLSGRQRQVLRLLAEGCTYAEIAARLSLSAETVRTHAEQAKTKLGARTRTQAVAIALRDGIID